MSDKVTTVDFLVVGGRVKIVGSHPFAGHSGVVEYHQEIGGYRAAMVRLDGMGVVTAVFSSLHVADTAVEENEQEDFDYGKAS